MVVLNAASVDGVARKVTVPAARSVETVCTLKTFFATVPTSVSWASLSPGTYSVSAS